MIQPSKSKPVVAWHINHKSGNGILLGKIIPRYNYKQLLAPSIFKSWGWNDEITLVTRIERGTDVRADSPNDTILQIQSGRCSANDVAYLKLNAVSYSRPFVQWKIGGFRWNFAAGPFPMVIIEDKHRGWLGWRATKKQITCKNSKSQILPSGKGRYDRFLLGPKPQPATAAMPACCSFWGVFFLSNLTIITHYILPWFFLKLKKLSPIFVSPTRKQTKEKWPNPNLIRPSAVFAVGAGGGWTSTTSPGALDTVGAEPLSPLSAESAGA